MSILIIVLTAADILIALMLIALVLVQQSKEGGFGSAFGGMGESVFGAHAQSHLSKLTVIFASLFMLITLSLTVITGRSHGPRSAVEELDGKEAKTESAIQVPVDPAPAADSLAVPTEVPGVVPADGIPGTVTVTPPAVPAEAPPAPAVPETP
jgi:preprotein translocase subunit SecG